MFVEAEDEGLIVWVESLSSSLEWATRVRVPMKIDMLVEAEDERLIV
jgi:hypothetical protein